MSKLKTISENPLDMVIPKATPQPIQIKPTPNRERITFHLPVELIDKLRNASYWSPGLAMAEIVERSVTEGLDQMEKKMGKPFPPRQGQLKVGKRVKAT